MPKPKYIISSDDVPNPLKQSGKGDSALVYSRADLKRRTRAAKKAGVKVKVRRFPG
jgi:hypothetical protein